MTTISRSALVPYTNAEMYALVNDVPAYPEFLPWVEAAEILFSNEDEVRARLAMVKGGFHKSFTTHNRLQRNKMIEMRLVEGPFRHLEGFWRFDAVGEDACQVSLDMDFEFASRWMGMAMGPMFTQVTGNLVDAFCKRAADVYGSR